MTGTDAPQITNPLEPFVLDNHRVMVGDLVLDLAMRTIHSRSQRTVKLSGNEFVILAMLVKNAGRFVSKPDLITAVAGSEINPHHSIVDTYMKYLYRQLQSADTSATIEKSTEFGFRLRP